MVYLEVADLSVVDVPEPVKGVSFNVDRGEMLSVLGPTGAGKTTLLRAIAGLVKMSNGSIRLDDADYTSLDALHRDVAVVFPAYSLYFHMTVEENISFPLKMQGIEKREIEKRVEAVTSLLGIGDLKKRKLRAISGGERQRVSIGRSIVRRPKLFMFDEPFTALDLKLREKLRSEVRVIQRDLGIAAIFVTTDPHEAMEMGDRVAVMRAGAMVEYGYPQDMYLNPRSRTTAEELVSPKMNFLNSAKIVSSIVSRETDRIGAQLGSGSVLPHGAVAGVRPESFRVEVAEDSEGYSCEVVLVERLGDGDVAYTNGDAGEIVAIVASGLVKIGDRVRLSVAEADLLFFDEMGNRLEI